MKQQRTAGSRASWATGRRLAWLLVAGMMLLNACRTAVADPTAPPPQPAADDPTPHPATALPVAGADGLQVSSPAPTPVPPTAAPTPTLVPVSEGLHETSFRLPPAVQHTTETTAELFFELGAPAEGLVIARAEGDSGAQRTWEIDPAAARQTVVLDDLTPGTRYKTQVVLADGEGTYEPPPYEGEAWGEVSFRTAGGERAGEPLFRTAVFGDSGFGDSVTYALAEAMAAYDLDFVIHTGDVVYRMYDENDPYQSYARKWFLPLEPLLRQGPVYPVVGNHDIEPAARVDGVPFYYSAFPVLTTADSPAGPAGGRQWYAVERGDIQILLLDTQTFFGETGRPEQDAWLAQRLADNRFAHTIAVHHVPPFSSGLHPDDGLPLRQSWVPSFEAANVRLALSGHDHIYERLEQNGVTYLVSGGGSATLYAQSTAQPQSVIFARSAHFVLVEAWAERIDYQAINLDGEPIDAGTIPLP